MFSEFSGFCELITAALDDDPRVSDPFALLEIALAIGMAASAADHGVKHYMDVPMDSTALTQTRSYASGEEKWQAINQENFDDIGEAALRLGSALKHISSAVEIRDEANAMWIYKHLGGSKPRWWFDFLHHYEPGCFQIAPRRLRRSTIALLSGHHAVRVRMEPEATATLTPVSQIIQEYDLSSVKATASVIEDGQRDVEHLWETYSLTLHRLKNGSSIKDLVKPLRLEFFGGLRSRERTHRAEFARIIQERHLRGQDKHHNIET